MVSWAKRKTTIIVLALESRRLLYICRNGYTTLQVYSTGYSITAILEKIECNGSRECNKGNIREIGSNVNTNKKVLEFGKIEANPLPAPHLISYIFLQDCEFQVT